MTDTETSNTLLKIPPHDRLTEAAVLCSMMLDKKEAKTIASMLTAEHFYKLKHQTVFKAICGLVDAGTDADIISVTAVLQATGKLDEVGGLAFVMELFSVTPTAAIGSHYAGVLCDYLGRRKLLALGMEIVSKSAADGADTAAIAEATERGVLAAIASAGRTKPIQTGSELVTETFNFVEEAHQRGGIMGTSTGFPSLDQMLSGFEPGFLYILAARPAMGKTSLAMDFATNVAAGGNRVLVFSAEMSSRDLMLRRFGVCSGVSSAAMRSGNIIADDWGRIAGAAAFLQSMPFDFDDTPNIDIGALTAKANRWAIKGNLGLIVIDYLQLLTGPGETRQEQVAAISRKLKAMARDLSVPVVACSQLSRALESRDDKRPRLSDLRESGGIEQDADVAMFLYRDDVYNPQSEDKGLAEVILGKNRHGAIGMRKLLFNAPLTTFTDTLSREAADQARARQMQRRMQES